MHIDAQHHLWTRPLLEALARAPENQSMSLTTDQLGRFATYLAGTPHLWQHLVRHSGDARVHEQIWDDERVNAWVICWSDDQDTGFHDHDEAAAAIVVVEGEIREERPRWGSPPAVNVMAPGTMFSVPPTAIHRVRHAGALPAVTIHAYSPPLRRTGAYRIGSGGELERIAQSNDRELRAEPALS